MQSPAATLLLSRDMFKIVLSGLHHHFILMKWEWTKWMLLYFMVSGTSSLVTVHQPPLLAVALGHDVNMPCQLLSHDEKVVTTRMLYWMYNSTLHLLHSATNKYKGRVHLLDHNTNSTNKSILFKNVQWADGGTYLCKVSVITEMDQRSRQKGNETLLIVYGTMLFNLTSHSVSQLQCEVNVTWDPRIVLSIFHNGWKSPTEGDAVIAPLYVTLSETISPKQRGKYECRLHLNEDLITKSIFHWIPPVAREGGDVEKSNSTAGSSPGSEPDVCEVCPEPWVLYTALLLVPVPILLGLVTALFLDRC